MSVAYKKNGTEIPITSAIMGGGIGYIDVTNKIGSITTAGGTFTATENCWCIANMMSSDNNTTAYVSYNDVLIAGSGSTLLPTIIPFPVKRGAVIKTRSNSGVYNIGFYKTIN